MTEDHDDTPDESGGRSGRSTTRWAAAISVASLIVAAAIAVPLLLFGNDPSDQAVELGSPGDGSGSPQADLLEYCLTLVEGDNQFVGTRRMQTLLRLVGAVSPDNHDAYMDFSLRLAGEHLRAGDAEESVRVLTEALEAEERNGLGESHKKTVLEDLAVAHLKLAELDNCVTSTGRFSCILPLQGATPHRVTRGATGAIDYLTRLLEIEPENVRYRWLLNIAHMTLGTYPGGIPDEYLVPPEVFEPDYEIGRFDEIGPESGIYDLSLAGGAIVDDFDNDGLLDIVTSTWDPCEPIAYYHNDGNGSFSDYTVSAGLDGQLGGLNILQADYDNDGWLDLFVAGFGDDIGDVASSYLGIPNDGATPRLYRNEGGAFVDITEEVGLDRVYLTMGANFGDLDGDGFPDLFLGTGFISYDSLGPNVAYRNDFGMAFQDVTFSGGFGHLQKGHGVAFGDLDRDGDEDIFVQMGGFFPGDAFLNALYENPGHGNRWLSIRLAGVRSNRGAIGARIKVTVATDDGERAVHAMVASGGSFGASSLEQEIGLGQARRIVRVEVRWPASGTTQVFDDVPLDTRIEITEGDDGYTVAALPSFKLAPFRTSEDTR